MRPHCGQRSPGLQGELQPRPQTRPRLLRSADARALDLAHRRACLMRMRTGSLPQSGACASRARGELEAGCRRAGSELAGTMLSPEAERVLQYLVEVEELAEAVLADKRQVGGPSAALGPGFGGWGLVASAVGKHRESSSSTNWQ